MVVVMTMTDDVVSVMCVCVVAGQGLDVPEVPVAAAEPAYPLSPPAPVSSNSYGNDSPFVSSTNPFTFSSSAGSSSLYDSSPVAAPAPALTGDELHMQRLREFFTENRPDNVPRVPELYGKLGKQIWAAMEAKYPGKTAKYTVVSRRGWCGCGGCCRDDELMVDDVTSVMCMLSLVRVWMCLRCLWPRLSRHTR